MPKAIQGICIYPVKTERRSSKFELADAVWSALVENKVVLQSGDIVAISSKYAAVAEGRQVQLSKVVPSKKALSLAERFETEASLAELVLQESDEILGGIPGFVLSTIQGTLAPNAGIDRSNAEEGWVILYPKDSDATSAALRGKLIRLWNRKNSPEKIGRLGVILTDSRITPTRLGTVGVALAVAGIRPTIDVRGTRDLYGNKLKVTLRAIADQAASAAQLVMGEAAESTPIAVIRGLESAFGSPRNQFEKNMTIPESKCLIINGLRNGTT